MKRLLSVIFAISYSFASFSQGNLCNAASAFCSGSTSYPAGVSAGTAEPGPNYGCLGSEPNPAWFFMQVSTSGNISLQINSTPPRDIDFILYGPFTSPSAPCTAQLTAANTEDCSYAGGTAPEYADITGGISGEYYLLLLTNYSNQPTQVSFSQTSGSGSTSCAVLCDITSLTSVPTSCTPATNTYSVSGQIAFTTQPTTGTLTVTGSCGGSQVFNAPFTSPINYNLTGMTANGAACSVTATFSATPSCTQTTPYTAPANCTPCTATASNSGPVCSGGNLTLMAGTVTGATSYSWSGPGGYTASTQNPVRAGVTIAASGTYTVTVTTASATCTATTTVLVNQTPATPVVTNNGPVCSGSTLNLSTTATGVTYNWTGPASFTSTIQNPSIASVTNTATGTYSLTVTSSGCTSLAGTTSVIINNTPNPPIPKVDGVFFGDTVCAGANITFTSNLIAGATYSWTGPNSYASAVRNPPAITGATPILSGTYSLTVTVGGCTSLPATLNLLVNPIPAAPTVNDTSICSGTTATLNPTAPGGTYDWYTAATGGTLISSGYPFTTPVLTDTTTYYVQSTINGCTGPRSAVTVNVSSSFTVSTIPDDSICSGASFVLGVEFPISGGYTYSWDSPSASGFSTSTAPTVSPAATSTYTVTLTDAIGCSGSDTIRITVGTPMIIDAAGSPATCFGSCNGSGNTLVSGSFNPYTYNWSNGTSLSTVNSLCAGTYTIIATDRIGCSIQNTIIIDEPTPITLTTSSVDSHCGLPDGSATVNASGGVPPYSYFWTPVGITFSTAPNLVPGTYCVRVTDSHGCYLDTCVNVGNIAGVTASATATATTCFGGCNGSATAIAASGTPPYTYSWNSGQTTASVSGLCAGTYTCTITDATLCSATATATVNQPTAVQVNPITAPADICIGQSTTLTATASGGSPAYTFNWIPAFTGSSYTVSPTDTTSYSVTATDASGCASINTQSVTVNVRPPLSGFATTTSTDICIGSSTILTAAGVSGGDGTYTYSWMPGSLTGSSVIVSPVSITTYVLTISDGCTTLDATSPVTINVQPKPQPKFKIDPYTTCVPTCLTFTDQTTISSGTFSPTWSIDGTIIGSTPGFCFNSGGTHSVSLLETSDHGCRDSIAKIDSIIVYDMPTAEFTFDPQPASVNFPTITFTDASTNATSWSWNFADSLYNPATNTSNIPSPKHDYAEAGTYCVDLIVNNTPACADTTEHCLVIQPDYTFYIPNSFTPNGNGLNDEFYPVGLNVATYEMQIYDRWGNLIFRTTDLNEHWKGNVKGTKEIAQEDVYVYIITTKDKVGERHQYIGHVTIVK